MSVSVACVYSHSAALALIHTQVKHQRVAEHQPAGPAENDRQQLGHAVGQEPPPQIGAELEPMVERGEGAQNQPVEEEQIEHGDDRDDC